MSYINEEAETIGFEKQKSLLQRLERSETVVFDVGGNIGQSIEKYRLLFPDCRIYSFEPHPESFSTLETRYGTANGVHCERLALGARSGNALFHATRRAEVSSVLAPEDFVRERSTERNYDFSIIEVPMDTLDRVSARLGAKNINILKLDVQGAEMEVLLGAESLLREGRIDTIYTEVLFAENYRGQHDFGEIWAHLKTFGYIPWDLFPFLHTSAGRIWTGNAIFVSPAAAQKLDPR